MIFLYVRVSMNASELFWYAIAVFVFGVVVGMLAQHRRSSK